MSAALQRILRLGAGLVYRGGRSACLPILVFHRSLPVADPMNPESPDAAALDRQFALIAALFSVMPLQEALDALREQRLPPRALAITFDDGYRDNYEVALPLLRRHGLTATLFVATDFLDGGLMFNDVVVEVLRSMPAGFLDLRHHGLAQWTVTDAASRSGTAEAIVQAIKYLPDAQRTAVCEDLRGRAGRALPDDLMMRSEELRAMARQGIDIGGHTCSHPILVQTKLEQSRHEISSNRDRLRDIVGKVPTIFAYPNGKPRLDYGPEHVQLVRDAGYRYAVSTSWGVAAPKVDIFQVPRFGTRGTTAAMITFEVARMARHRRAPVT